MSGDTYYNTNTENKNNTPPPSPPAQRAQSDAQIAKAFGKMTIGAAQVTAVTVGLAIYGTVKGSIALAKWGAKAYKKHKEENELAENLLMQKTKPLQHRNKLPMNPLPCLCQWKLLPNTMT